MADTSPEVLELHDLDAPTKALTDWKKEPTLEELKRDLQDAQPAHNAQIEQIQEWLDNLHVEGKAKPKTRKGRSSVQPKLIRKQAEWRYPSLSEPFLEDDDIFQVKPVTWEDVQAARQNQLVLNHQFNNQLNKVAFIDEYVRTAVDEGTVIVKVGWDFEEEEVEIEVPLAEFTPDPSFAPVLEQALQLEQQSPSEFQALPQELKEALVLSQETGVPHRPQIVGYETEKVMRTVRNQPTLEVCDYRNVIPDPTCQGNLNKAGFIIYHFETSLAALKRDGRYKNLDQIHLENASPLNEPDHGSDYQSHNFNFQDKARKKFVVYEYWGFRDLDGSGKLTPFVAAWVGKTLIRMERNPFPDQKLPFIAVPYLPKRKQLHGEPDGALLDDNQAIMGAVTRGMIDLLGRSANGQTGMRKDMLDATNRRRFERGEDYEFNQSVDPRQGVYMHQFSEIPVSAQWLLQQQAVDAESLTGVKAYNDGVSSESLGDLAAGVRGALDASSKRERDILRRLKHGLVEIAHKLIAMNTEFLSEEEVIRITNDEFVNINREDLQSKAGRFDLVLKVSSPEERNAQAQDLAFIFQTLGPNTDPSIAMMILADIARLKKRPELAQKLESWQPQPDPMEQQIKQLEIQKLVAEIEKIRSETVENQAEAQLDMAKIGSEQAKAGKTAAEMDKLNLDYVEQESGVTQERELQQHGEQARAQMGLKLLDRQFDLEDQAREDLKEYLQNRTD